MSPATNKRLQLWPLGDPEQFTDQTADPTWWDKTLRDFLTQFPALSLAPIAPQQLDALIKELVIEVMPSLRAEQPLYLPQGIPLRARPIAPAVPGPQQPTDPAPGVAVDAPTGATAAPATTAGPAADEHLSPAAGAEVAVRRAYGVEIDAVGEFLRARLSVLVTCDKLVVPYLWREMAIRGGLEAKLLEVAETPQAPGLPGIQSQRQAQFAELKGLLHSIKDGHVLVLPHLDLLAGGDTNLAPDSRELIELLYGEADRLLLAFVDRSLQVPEVLAARFAVHFLFSGVQRQVVLEDGRSVPLGRGLLTEAEIAMFKGFDEEGLYKNVAGLNPIRLRHAILYAVQKHKARGQVPVQELYSAIRAFKAQTSAKFEVPDVGFTDIGGYDHVKAELRQALELMAGAYGLPSEKLRRDLVPRGLIFHGPPGTGKTLFAKAIANKLNATIRVISGPEVTDMYVGESERKIREVFADGRRNAPSVIVFDEFDSIATKRSGREDGGSRAGNAVVAQILTEMDGFRPDVPMLVIGTTNRLDIIDEALLRPSRFRPIHIGLPDLQARRAIARVHAEHFQVPVSQELIEAVAEAAAGLNGDEIRSLFRDACIEIYCLNPGATLDARRLGRILGRMRNAKEKILGESHREPVLTPGPQGRRRAAPSGPMISLTAGTGSGERTEPP